MYLKKCLLILLLFYFQYNFAQKCKTYKVLEIDSTKSYYFIKVKRNFSKYLIISPKIDKTDNSKKIVLGNKYELCLKEYTPEEFILNDFEYSISLEGKVVWERGKRKFNAYITNSLLGLNR